MHRGYIRLWQCIHHITRAEVMTFGRCQLISQMVVARTYDFLDMHKIVFHPKASSCTCCSITETTDWFEVRRACLSIPAPSRSSLSLGSLPTCCLLQLPTSLFIVILTVTDSKNTTHHCRWPCCALPVAGSHLWNSLPHVVTSAPTLLLFSRRGLRLTFSFVHSW